ncbi:MAG TPA: CDP-glycerol--glycerophosphate glycerophosphotransferase [Bacteroidales bacterium]|nr:CDP-glycerol--glycerophosphate glycerophosphotransferase [Bacteroidales bacterium]
MSSIRNTAKKFVPSVRLRKYLKSFADLCLIHSAPLRHSRSLKRIKGKAVIKVAFFVVNGAIWKLDDVFRMMMDDKRFDPVIIVCPYISYNGEMMKIWMNDAYNLFTGKQYPVLMALNTNTERWLDVKNEIRPDIIFFTTSYQLTREDYYIRNFPDHLTCYVPYAFMTPNTYDEQFNQFFHNAVWRAFYETPIHKEIAVKYARNRGRNVRVTGYPGCDPFLDKSHKPADIWKKSAAGVKRVIWAPHHLMKEGLKTSNFLNYSGIMLDIAKKYQGKLQFVLKPHPMLKPKLYQYPEWGKKKTDDYFREWEDLPNGQVEEGDYIDLFLTSDALILDCGSFITEYMFTGKPSVFMISNEDVMTGWNEYGEKALSVLYHSRKFEELNFFIESVVIGGKDTMREKRIEFIKEVLMPPGNRSASENIFNGIVGEIWPI